VGVVVAWAAWRFGSPRRLLLYGLDSDTPLLSGDARARAAGAKLQIILGGKELSDPHFVAITLVSRSRRDIRPDDFIESRPLALDLAAPVLAVLACDTGGDKMPDVKMGTDGSKVTVGPGLINRRQVISLDLLTDGPVTLTCPNPSLADVSIREREDESKIPTWLKRVFYVGIITFLVGIALAAIGQSHHPLVNAIGGSLIVVVVFAVPLAAAVWGLFFTVRNAGYPRRPTRRSGR
jgi:hypothetical protein